MRNFVCDPSSVRMTKHIQNKHSKNKKPDHF
ncbi:hypothetical protein GKZ88_04975 [Flavobacterium sp. LC2016-01]|nr:hypothetical protein [Flavobacterium sp. LC2016-01]